MNGGPVARLDNMTKRKVRQGRKEISEENLVVPGDDLGDSEGFEAGHGVLVMSGRLKALKQGKLRKRANQYQLSPYTPDISPDREIW